MKILNFYSFDLSNVNIGIKNPLSDIEKDASNSFDDFLAQNYNSSQNQNLDIAQRYVLPTGQNLKTLKNSLYELCKNCRLLGTILISEEGINASLAAKEEDLNFVFEKIYKLFPKMQFKFSKIDFIPFTKLKVKIKPEIVSFKTKTASVEKNKGIYVSPKDWDEIVSNPDNIVIDVRNDYEFHHGSFLNSINPKTKCYSEFPEWIDKNIDKLKEKKVYMYCTGGIRCEKATTYLKTKYSHPDTYHLEGGILNYLDLTKNSNSKWTGKCFVFDDRILISEKDF